MKARTYSFFYIVVCKECGSRNRIPLEKTAVEIAVCLRGPEGYQLRNASVAAVRWPYDPGPEELAALGKLIAETACHEDVNHKLNPGGFVWAVGNEGAF